MNYTMESFIKFCDENNIAEESMKSINDKYNEYFESIEELSRQLKSEDSVDKAITLEKSILQITKDYAQEISNDKLSTKDKIVHYTSIAVGAGIGVFSVIGAPMSRNQFLPLIAGSVGGSIAGTAIGNMTSVGTIKTIMNNLVKSHESALTVLQKFKSLGFKSCKEARSKYKVTVEKGGSVKLTEKTK